MNVTTTVTRATSAARTSTKPEVTLAYATLSRLVKEGFIGRSQRAALTSALFGQEQQYFVQKIAEIDAVIKAMPKTYQQDGLGKKAVVHLHYFIGSCDFHITEKDRESTQEQAFGLANIGYGGELGYISLTEITSCGAELDLYWTPKTLEEISK